MKALLSLSPSESKKLIGRAVTSLPEFQRAFSEGLVIIAVGSTTSQVAKACTHNDIDESRFAAGIIARGVLCVTPRAQRLPNLVLHKGKPKDIPPLEALELDGPKVLVKGANAVDPQGMAGVLMAARDGGTAGRLVPHFQANGWPLISPVGLEKLVPSVLDAVSELGIDKIDVSLGARVGMMPLAGARVITEREALNTIAKVRVTHVASGGVGDSQGSVSVLVEGQSADVEKIMEEVKQVKGATIASPVLMSCETCHHECDFKGQSTQSLPPYLQMDK